MKKRVFILTMVSAMFSLFSCDNGLTDQMTPDYPKDGDVTYGIRQVMQYDPMNINGIDVAGKFDFFSTLKLTIHITDSKITAMTYTNGDVPFSPYDFEIPTGRFDCVLDTEVLPNVLRIKGTNNVIAIYKKGEFIVPFQLDSKALSYEYTFKNFE